MTGHGLFFYFIQLTAIRRFGSASTQPNVYVLRAFRKCTCCDSEIVRESDELNQIFFTFSLFHRLFVVLNLIKVYKVVHEMLIANLIFQKRNQTADRFVIICKLLSGRSGPFTRSFIQSVHLTFFRLLKVSNKYEIFFHVTRSKKGNVEGACEKGVHGCLIKRRPMIYSLSLQFVVLCSGKWAKVSPVQSNETSRYVSRDHSIALHWDCRVMKSFLIDCIDQDVSQFNS